MRYGLLLIGLLLLSPSLAAADHLGVFSDATGTFCDLAAGFTSTVTVVQKFSLGSTGSRFRLEFPAGSSFFSFSTPFPIIGSAESDISIGYGQCMSGTFEVGTIVAVLTQGLLWVHPAVGFLNVRVTDCAFVEKDATCGGAYVGYGCCNPYCPSCQFIATDQKTWGAVKALYRE